MAKGLVILLVEDSDGEVAPSVRAFRTDRGANPVQVAQYGQEALAFLAAEGKCHHWHRCPGPAQVLLDLGSPGIDRFEVFRCRDAQWMVSLPWRAMARITRWGNGRPAGAEIPEEVNWLWGHQPWRRHCVS